MLDRAEHLSERVIVVQIDLFILQRTHESLRDGVIVGITDAAHADSDLVLTQDIDVVMTSVLHPTIGVMSQLTGSEGARVQGHFESCQ